MFSKNLVKSILSIKRFVKENENALKKKINLEENKELNKTQVESTKEVIFCTLKLTFKDGRYKRNNYNRSRSREKTLEFVNKKLQDGTTIKGRGFSMKNKDKTYLRLVCLYFIHGLIGDGVILNTRSKTRISRSMFFLFQ